MVGEVLFRGLLKVYFQIMNHLFISIKNEISAFETKAENHPAKEETNNKFTGSEGLKHERTPNRHRGNMASIF